MSRAGKHIFGARDVKYKFGAKTGKHKLRARAGKYKSGSRASKYKLGSEPGVGWGATARVGGREIQIPVKVLIFNRNKRSISK